MQSLTRTRRSAKLASLTLVIASTLYPLASSEAQQLSLDDSRSQQAAMNPEPLSQQEEQLEGISPGGAKLDANESKRLYQFCDDLTGGQDEEMNQCHEAFKLRFQLGGNFARHTERALVQCLVDRFERGERLLWLCVRARSRDYADAEMDRLTREQAADCACRCLN